MPGGRGRAAAERNIMDDLLLQSRLSMPVRTGAAGAYPAAGTAAAARTKDGLTFQQIFEELQSRDSGLSFSKHAAKRLEEREISLSQSGLQRLDEGVRIAKEKGLNDTLIIVDDSAFVVNTANNRVITSLSSLRGRVITNIDGTVIV